MLREVLKGGMPKLLDVWNYHRLKDITTNTIVSVHSFPPLIESDVDLLH